MKIIGMYDPYDLQIIIDNSNYELHFILIVWQLDIDGHVAPAAVPESLFCLGLNISKAKLNLKLKFLVFTLHSYDRWNAVTVFQTISPMHWAVWDETFAFQLIGMNKLTFLIDAFNLVANWFVNFKKFKWFLMNCEKVEIGFSFIQMLII